MTVATGGFYVPRPLLVLTRLINATGSGCGWLFTLWTNDRLSTSDSKTDLIFYHLIKVGGGSGGVGVG
jgi:hypothetical protein